MHEIWKRAEMLQLIIKEELGLMRYNMSVRIEHPNHLFVLLVARRKYIMPDSSSCLLFVSLYIPTFYFCRNLFLFFFRFQFLQHPSAVVFLFIWPLSSAVYPLGMFSFEFYFSGLKFRSLQI